MHTLAYYASIAQNNLLTVANVADPIFFASSNRFLIPEELRCYWAMALGTTINRARLVMPTYAPQGYPYIMPLQRPTIGSNILNVANYTKNPLRLPPKQYLEAQAEQTSAGAEVEAIVIGVGKQLEPAMPGQVTTIRGTATTAAVAGAWTQLTVTWEYTLEGGFYQLVGGFCSSANGIAWRAIGQFQIERPGGPSIRNIAQDQPQMFDAYGLGKWLEFQSESMPQIEVLCGAADASHTVYLNVVKVR